DRATCLVCARPLALDGERFRSAMDSNAVNERLSAVTRDALRHGVFGVPTFFVGDRMFGATIAWHFLNTTCHAVRGRRTTSLVPWEPAVPAIASPANREVRCHPPPRSATLLNIDLPLRGSQRALKGTAARSNHSPARGLGSPIHRALRAPRARRVGCPAA